MTRPGIGHALEIGNWLMLSNELQEVAVAHRTSSAYVLM
jgi:hypothetical protein